MRLHFKNLKETYSLKKSGRMEKVHMLDYFEMLSVANKIFFAMNA